METFLDRLIDMDPEIVEGGSDAFNAEDFIDSEEEDGADIDD